MPIREYLFLIPSLRLLIAGRGSENGMRCIVAFLQAVYISAFRADISDYNMRAM